jgi:hypothetical protein
MSATYWCEPRRVMIIAAAMVSTLACVSAGPVRAQQTTQNGFTDLSQYLISGNQVVPRQASATTAPATGGLSSSVIQIGQGNVTSATLNGINNVTNQIQNGSANSSTLSVNGMQNAVTTSQIGSSNTTSIGINGNGNSVSNLQVGSGLSYQIQVIGTSVPVSVQQFGRK